jgi:hypothetical protein
LCGQRKHGYRRANEIRVGFYLTLDEPLGEIGGSQTLEYGWLPIPANVQPDVPRQLVFAPVEVSVSSQMGWALDELDMWIYSLSGQD